MFKFFTKSFAPKHQGARNGKRHLHAAERAVIESMEQRLMFAVTPVAAEVESATSSASTFNAALRTSRHRTSGSTTTTVVAPASPTTVTATTVDSASIKIAWTAGDSTATGYYVQRSTDGTTFTQVADVTAATFTDTGLAAGMKYVYRVLAYNTAGSSTASATASATTTVTSTTTPGTTTTTTPGTTITGSLVKPLAATTGVLSSIALTTVSGFTGKSNTTYSNLHITGQVNLTGLTNVTLINCVIDANGAPYDVRCDNASGIKIMNCELKGASSAGVYGDGFTATANYVHQIGGDGFKPRNNAVIEGNYVTELGYNTVGAHADGVQISNGNNVTISGNFFNMPINVMGTASNSALFLQNATTNVTFSGNWVLGGNYALHVYSDTDNTTIKIMNNVYFAGSTRYGFATIGTGVVWSGNVTDTGLTALPKTK